MSDLSGKQIRGYELKAKIGAGGFGAVYKAAQPIIGREVAIKVILPELANQPEFIRRFESEARLVARLEHPNIIPLYDYWRDPNGAYLVMRWLSGGSLRSLLQKHETLPPEQVARILDQLTAALMVSHRAGIIHRDLKPENVLLDDDENVYLADFGIAKDMGTREDADSSELVGSPAYLSPEQIRGQPVTPQTDIYALGIVLYELLTGKRPFAGDATSTQLIFSQLNDPLPLLHDELLYLPSRLDAVLRQATAKNPAERYADTRALAADFRKALATATETAEFLMLGSESDDILSGSDRLVDSDASPHQAITVITIALEPENPFKGLRAFQEVDSADFFGREALIEQLVDRLREETPNKRFLAVVGPSGSGKSSVVKAGIIPSLRRGALPGSDRWFYVEMTPGATPFQELEAALLSVATQPLEGGTFTRQIAAGQRSLAQMLDALLPPDPNLELVLVIDQFEDVFTQGVGEAVTKLFLASLMTAVSDPKSRLRLIVTLRADYYDRPLLHPAFGDLMRQRTEVVLPLSPAELALAISGPAERVGLRLEPGLVETIVADVGEQPGALPLLQYALTELYERRKRNLLLLDAYRESGGALGALARRADELYAGLDTTKQNAVRQLFLRLVTLGEGVEDTRRRTRRTEFIGTDNAAALNAVLDAYSKYRLLTFDVDPETRVPTVEVAHEALIRTWQRLRTWLDDNRELVRTHRRLGAATLDWKNASRDVSFLASGGRLTQYEGLLENQNIALNKDEVEYVRASVAERDRLIAEEARRKAHELELAQQAAKSAAEAAKNAQAAAKNAESAAVAQRTAANRLRYLAILMAGAFVVAILLMLFALSEQSRATSNERIALANAATATIAQGQAQNNAATSVANAATATIAQGQAQNNAATSVANAATATVARGQAQNNAATAQANFTRSEALRFAAEMQIHYQQNGDPRLTNLLALQSIKTQVTPNGINALALAATVSQPIQEFSGLEFQNFDVSISPDGKYVLAADDYRIKLLSVATSALVYQIDPNERTFTAVISHDGKYFLTGGSTGRVRKWNLADGAPLDTLVEKLGQIAQITISNDDKTIALVEDNNLRILDARTGQPIGGPIVHPGATTSVAFSPDGTLIVTGCGDQKAYLWNLKGEKQRELVGHTDSVSSVAFSPDAQVILTGSFDRTARVWDAKSGEVITTLTGHTDKINRVAFSPDMKHIATASGDRTVSLFNLTTLRGGSLFTLQNVLVGYPSGVLSLAFAPDSASLLAASDLGALRRWAVEDSAALRVFRGMALPISRIVYSQDGKWVLSVAAYSPAFLRDARSGAIVDYFGNVDTSAAALSPDGQMVVTGSSNGVVQLWRVGKADPETISGGPIGHTGVITSMQFSPDMRSVLSTGEDGLAILWNIADPKAPPIALKGHTKVINDGAFALDGKLVITAGADKSVRFWKPTNGELVGKYDGTRGTFGEMVRKFEAGTGSFIRLAVSPTQDRVAVTSDDGAITIIRTTDLSVIRTIQYSSSSYPLPVAYSPDGKTLIAGGNDKRIVLLDAETGNLLQTYSGHTDWLLSLTFSPDGQYILSGSYDNTVRQWDTDYRKTIDLICGRLLGDFTGNERQDFAVPAAQTPLCPQFGGSPPTPTIAPTIAPTIVPTAKP